MEILFTTSKGRLMDTTQRFHISKETRINNQINEKNTVKPNVIFETMFWEDTSRVHTFS
jgi:hypothetical protein